MTTLPSACKGLSSYPIVLLTLPWTNAMIFTKHVVFWGKGSVNTVGSLITSRTTSSLRFPQQRFSLQLMSCPGVSKKCTPDNSLNGWKLPCELLNYLLSGQLIPILGMGTWQMGENARNRQSEIDTLRHRLELGLTLIDTAEIYGEGGAEEVIVQAITPTEAVAIDLT